MIWLYALLLLCAYLGIAWLVRGFAFSLVGESPAGRRAVPVVAILWLPCLWLLVAIALIALVEHGFDEATGWMRSGIAER